MTIVDLHCRNAFCTPALSRSISYLVGNALVRTRMSGSDKRGREREPRKTRPAQAKRVEVRDRLSQLNTAAEGIEKTRRVLE